MRLKICLHSRRKNTASSSWSVSKWNKRNGYNWPENQFSLAGMRLFFKNWISRFPQIKKNL